MAILGARLGSDILFVLVIDLATGHGATGDEHANECPLVRVLLNLHLLVLLHHDPVVRLDVLRRVHQFDLGVEVLSAELDHTLGKLIAKEHAESGQDQVHGLVALVRPVGFVEHSLRDESVAEREVLLLGEPRQIRLLMLVLGQAERRNQLLQLRVHQEGEVLAFELFDGLDEPWDEVVLEDELTGAVRVLDRISLRVFFHLFHVVAKRSILVGEVGEDGIDHVVKLLELAAESAHVLVSTVVVAVNIEELSADDWLNDGGLVNEKATDLAAKLLLRRLLLTQLPLDLPLSAALLLSDAGHGKILGLLL